MCWKDDNSAAVSSEDFGVGLGERGGVCLVCALLLKLCWDQRLGEALIRGQTLSGGLPAEAGPPIILPSHHLIYLKLGCRVFTGPGPCRPRRSSWDSKGTRAPTIYCVILTFSLESGGARRGCLTSVSVPHLVAAIWNLA